ncbi:hypothetical protein T484DRAFT_3024077 [Baffinella frigidus]|nr:hypothetical protein T484DRAFT_3024077 [Cryptophyta sp. CCMP2293]
MRNGRVSQHNAMDHRRTSTSQYTSELEALFPSPPASRHLPRLRQGTTSVLPPNTAGKDTGRPSSNDETHFQRRLSSADTESAEELVPTAFVFPTRSAPTPSLRFPVQFYAIGQCLAHPDGEEGGRCKCVKTREMAQSQACAWRELGSRFKQVECTKISRRNLSASAACLRPPPARPRPRLSRLPARLSRARLPPSQRGSHGATTRCPICARKPSSAPDPRK